MKTKLQHGDISVHLMPASTVWDHKGNATEIPEGWTAAWFCDRLPFLGWRHVNGPLPGFPGGRFATEAEATQAACEAVEL